MAEQEELRLTVTVDDRATAQLQALRGQLSSMGTGAQAAGMERMRRQSTEVGVSIGGLSEAMRGMATRAGVIGGVVGAVTTKLIDLGAQFVQRVTDVKAYSEALLTLQRNAHLAGTGAAQFQANMSQMQEKAGVGAEQAAASLKKFSEVHVDLQRENSKTRNELMSGFRRPEDRAAMGNMLSEAAQADVTEAANITLRGIDRIEKNLLARGDSPALAAQARARALARFGFSEELPRGFQFERISPEQQARVDARMPAALRHQELLRQESAIWTEIQSTVSAIILEYGGFNTGLETTNAWAVSIKTELAGWETNLRKAGGVLNLLKENIPPWMKGETAPDTRPRAGPGERPTERDLEERAAAIRAAEAQKRAQEAADAAARVGATRPPSAPVRRTGIAPSRFGPRSQAPAQPGAEPATEPAVAPDQATIDAEAAAKAEADRLEARRQEMLLRRRSAAGATPPPPVTTAPPPAGGLIPRGATSAPVARPPGFTESRISTTPPPPGVVPVLPPPPPVIVETGSQPPPIVVMPPETKPPPIIIPPMSSAPIIVPQAVAPMPWTVPQPPRQLGPLDTPRAPSPSALEGGTTSLMGGPTMDQNQVAQTIDARALDRASSRDVNVNGTGKISVDVRAPAGTNVKAQGQGLFKKTEITRQTQMMPAEYGPQAATGVGAAEGPF